VSCHLSGVVVRLDAERPADDPKAVLGTRLGRRPWAIAADGKGAWVARADGTVVLLADEDCRPVAAGEGGAAPLTLALDGDVLWVASLRDGEVRRLEAGRGSPVGDEMPLGTSAEALAAAGGEAWALCEDGIVLLASSAVDRVRPADEREAAAERVLELPERETPEVDAPPRPCTVCRRDLGSAPFCRACGTPASETTSVQAVLAGSHARRERLPRPVLVALCVAAVAIPVAGALALRSAVGGGSSTSDAVARLALASAPKATVASVSFASADRIAGVVLDKGANRELVILRRGKRGRWHVAASGAHPPCNAAPAQLFVAAGVACT
jgi:hypothetical protein